MTTSHNIRASLELCKLRIALATTLSAAAGYLLASTKMDSAASTLAGVFLLSCGAAALNQYQERSVDAIMQRTKKRPLPSGRVRPAGALLFSSAMLLAGSFLLFIASGVAFILGCFAVFWYNGVYTHLKRRTAFAVVPGALIGAIPVAIGWVSGGGNIRDPKIAFLCFFFFMWQVPHFWLFLQKYGEEYRMAGLRSVTSVFSSGQLARINFVWMSAAGVSCILLTATGIARNSGVNMILVLLSCMIIWSGRGLVRRKVKVAGRLSASGLINIYIVVVSAVLSVDRFI